MHVNTTFEFQSINFLTIKDLFKYKQLLHNHGSSSWVYLDNFWVAIIHLQQLAIIIHEPESTWKNWNMKHEKFPFLLCKHSHHAWFECCPKVGNSKTLVAKHLSLFMHLALLPDSSSMQ